MDVHISEVLSFTCVFLSVLPLMVLTCVPRLSWSPSVRCALLRCSCLILLPCLVLCPWLLFFTHTAKRTGHWMNRSSLVTTLSDDFIKLIGHLMMFYWVCFLNNDASVCTRLTVPSEALTKWLQRNLRTLMQMENSDATATPVKPL